MMHVNDRNPKIKDQFLACPLSGMNTSYTKATLHHEKVNSKTDDLRLFRCRFIVRQFVCVSLQGGYFGVSKQFGKYWAWIFRSWHVTFTSVPRVEAYRQHCVLPITKRKNKKMSHHLNSSTIY